MAIPALKWCIYISSLGCTVAISTTTTTASVSTVDSNSTATNNTDTKKYLTMSATGSYVDDQIKPALTIASLTVFALIGLIVARLVDRWWDRKEPAENESDCSEKTRELLKARFGMMAFENMDGQSVTGVSVDVNADGNPVGGEPEEGGEAANDDMRAKPVSKLWMMRTAVMGEKRKKGAADEEKAIPSGEDQLDLKDPKVYLIPDRDDKAEEKLKKEKDFIDVQFTHHRVEESFTISQKIDPKDLPESGDKPYVYKYRHVSEDVLIPVRRMLSPEAVGSLSTQNSKANMRSPTSPPPQNDKDMPNQLGYYAELTLAPTRLGHYADSDFGSDTSLDEPNKTTKNPDGASHSKAEAKPPGEGNALFSPAKPGAKQLKDGKQTVAGGANEGKAPTKTRFSSKTTATKPSVSSDSSGKHDQRYEDDFESVSTYDANKRIQTGKTDKTDLSFASGPTIGTSRPSVGTGFSEETPRDVVVTEAQKSKVPVSPTSNKTLSHKPQHFDNKLVKDNGKAKRITVQPRI